MASTTVGCSQHAMLSLHPQPDSFAGHMMLHKVQASCFRGRGLHDSGITFFSAKHCTTYILVRSQVATGAATQQNTHHCIVSCSTCRRMSTQLVTYKAAVPGFVDLRVAGIKCIRLVCDGLVFFEITFLRLWQCGCPHMAPPGLS